MVYIEIIIELNMAEGQSYHCILYMENIIELNIAEDQSHHGMYRKYH